jgi:hypothetical protein
MQYNLFSGLEGALVYRCVVVLEEEIKVFPKPRL